MPRSTTVSLKVFLLNLIVVFGLHVAGFCLQRWSHFKFTLVSVADNAVVVKINCEVHVGLWKDCSCCNVLANHEFCSCDSEQQKARAFITVQALETISFVGLVISGLITGVVLSRKQENILKVINIVIAFCSGFLIVLGAVVYAVKCHNNYDRMLKHDLDSLFKSDLKNTDWLEFQSDFHTASLTTSFILCTIAGSLFIIGSVTLLVVEIRAALASKEAEQQPQSMPVQYIDQGRMSTITGQVIIHAVAQQPSLYPSSPAYGYLTILKNNIRQRKNTKEFEKNADLRDIPNRRQ